MRLNKANVLAISLLVELTVILEGSAPVSMYVRLESTSFNFLYLNFYNDTFRRLYDCMKDTDNEQCNVGVMYDGTPRQGINWKATSVTPLPMAHLDQSYFTCLFKQASLVLQCTRYNTGQCGKDTCASFHLRGSTICDNQCVYLMWMYAGEQLLLATGNFEYCDPVCTTTTMHIPNVHSTKPSSHASVTSTRLPSDQTSDATCDPVSTATPAYIPAVHNITSSTHPSVTSTRLPSDQTSDPTTNSSSAADVNNADSRKRSPAKQISIIIGVVCSLVVIIIIVVAIGIIYRRKKLIKRHAGNNGMRSSHTDAKANGGRGQRSLSSTRNASNTPDVLTSLPHSGRGSDINEPEDGYYTIDKEFQLNRYENGLNTVSSGTSPVEGYALDSRELKRYENLTGPTSSTFRIQEQVDHSQIPNTHEGDYFVISENDDDKDNGSVNEDMNVEGGYSLAKDVRIDEVTDLNSRPNDVNVVDITDVSSRPNDVNVVDIIDVSSQPKNVYSRFGSDTTVRNNPYDMLLQPNEILDPRNTSIGVTPMKGTVGDDTQVANTTTTELAETNSRMQTTIPNMTRDTTVVFPEYSKVNKTKT